MFLCLRIEPSIQVCCPPVLTNRLPEVKIGDKLQERIHGFEPRIKVWKTLVLPLHHIRNVESGRFRILLLYPLSGCLTFGITLSVLPSHQGIIRHTGYYVKPPIWFEQTTDGLQNHCSTTELQGQTPLLGNAPSNLRLTVGPIRLLGRGEWFGE